GTRNPEGVRLQPMAVLRPVAGPDRSRLPGVGERGVVVDRDLRLDARCSLRCWGTRRRVGTDGAPIHMSPAQPHRCGVMKLANLIEQPTGYAGLSMAACVPRWRSWTVGTAAATLRVVRL